MYMCVWLVGRLVVWWFICVSVFMYYHLFCRLEYLFVCVISYLVYMWWVVWLCVFVVVDLGVCSLILCIYSMVYLFRHVVAIIVIIIWICTYYYYYYYIHACVYLFIIMNGLSLLQVSLCIYCLCVLFIYVCMPYVSCACSCFVFSHACID